jgi:hypothetical protein
MLAARPTLEKTAVSGWLGIRRRAFHSGKIDDLTFRESREQV